MTTHGAEEETPPRSAGGNAAFIVDPVNLKLEPRLFTTLERWSIKKRNKSGPIRESTFFAVKCQDFVMRPPVPCLTGGAKN